jgi:hypothetical protein
MWLLVSQWRGAGSEGHIEGLWVAGSDHNTCAVNLATRFWYVLTNAVAVWPTLRIYFGELLIILGQSAGEISALCDLCHATGLCTRTDVTGWQCSGLNPVSTQNPCPAKWTGLTCGNGNKVEGLSFGGKSLVGSVPTQLHLCSYLTLVDFKNNLLSGVVPSILGRYSYE